MQSDPPSPSLYERLGGHAGLERLLSRFYDRAREDDLLGPIFGAHVHDWDSHLQTVVHFWSNHTGGPVLYRGGMGRHFRLGLEPQHFERWLSLWRSNAELEVGPECAEELHAIASRVAANLKAMAAQASALNVGGPSPRPGSRFGLSSRPSA
jgi:hemoglobin